MTAIFDSGTWMLAVAFFAGLFLMMLTWLFETLTLRRPMPGPVGLAVVILVVSLYCLGEVVLRPGTVAFLVPPPY